MNRTLLSLLLLAALGCASATHAAEGWAQLKVGLTLEKAAAAVGLPLIKSRGRGYDLWIYDGGGEVIASQGAVVAWTRPAGANPSGVRPSPAAVVRAPMLAVPVKAAVAQSGLNLPAGKSAVPPKNT